MNDPENARSLPLRPIADVARALGLGADGVAPSGPHSARVRLDLLAREPIRPSARYVVVCGTTPPPGGVGVTTHAIGLATALGRIGGRTVCTIRQPCAGEIPGAGGGSPGGGRSEVVPRSSVERQTSAVVDAVAAAHDRLAACADVFDGGGRDRWRPPSSGRPGASEVMAVLALATDRADLRACLERVAVGTADDGVAVRAGAVGVADELVALLDRAIEPILMRTSDGTPALLHGAPDVITSAGCPSVVADLLALRCADVVVTEAPAGTDLGAERFFNIKCRASGLRPHAAVLVCTVRGLKQQSGSQPSATAGEDLDAVRAGSWNLERHVANLRMHGLPVVVAVNRFPDDGGAELELVRDLALRAGAFDAVVSGVFADGPSGGDAMAHAVKRAVEEPPSFRFLYPRGAALRHKLEVVAVRVLGARGVAFTPAAAAELERLEANGCGRLPVCIAKTPFSVSHDPARTGRPEGFTLPIRGVRASFGAGFVTAFTEELRPG